MYQNGDKIDADKLIAAVREAAAERPDFVYRRNPGSKGPVCFYTQADGTPDCIIGVAMAKIGQPLPPQLREGGDEIYLLHGPVSSFYWAEALNLPQDGDKVGWLGTVQCAQDMGTPWGAAVVRADREFGNQL